MCGWKMQQSVQKTYTVLYQDRLQILIDKVTRCFWAVVTISPQNFSFYDKPFDWIKVGSMTVDLREVSALWAEIWTPLSQTLLKLFTSLACSVTPAIFPGSNSLCCASFPHLRWVNEQEHNNITVKLSSADTALAVLFLVNGGQTSPFTPHQGTEAAWHLQRCLLRFAFLTCHRLDMRLMEPHKQCNWSCLTGPRPFLLKPLVKDSQICRKRGILKAILLFLFVKMAGQKKGFLSL